MNRTISPNGIAKLNCGPFDSLKKEIAMFWKSVPTIPESLTSVSEEMENLRLQIAERDATIRELDKKLTDALRNESELRRLSEELYLEVKRIQFNHGASLRKIEVLNAKIQHQNLDDDDDCSLTETDDDELINELNRTLCNDDPKCEMCGENLMRTSSFFEGKISEQFDICMDQGCELFHKKIRVKKPANG